MKLIRGSLLTMVLAFLFSISVYAGDSFDLSGISVNGIKSDNTVDSGSTITISISDLMGKLGDDFKNEFNNAHIKIFWAISDNESGESKPVEYYSGTSAGTFSISVKNEYAGKYLRFCTKSTNGNTSYNLNTSSYKVNSTNATVNLTWDIKYQNPKVMVQWDYNSRFISGSYIERQDTSTNAIVKLGNVSSDYSYKRYDDSTVVNGKTYKYRVVRGLDYSNWSGSITIPNTASSSSGGSSSSGSSGSSSSGSGGSSSSGSSGNTSKSTGSSGSSASSTLKPPAWSDASVLIRSIKPGVAEFYVYSGAYDLYFEAYKGSSKIIDKKLAYYGSYTKNITIPYGKKTSFKYRLYFKSGSKKACTGWKKKSLTSMKLSRPGLSVTKISNTKAGLKWSTVSGATGYKIYKGSKVVKTLGNKKTAYICSGKGAGSAKYKVAPVIKNSTMKKAVTGTASKAKKGKPNVRTYGSAPSVTSYKYGVATFKPTKISLSGNTYTITGYAINNRMFDLIKFNKLDIILYCDGKKVGRKVFKNMKASCKKYSKKKISFKIKGKGGVDFRNAEGITIQWKQTPYWKGVGAKPY